MTYLRWEFTSITSSGYSADLDTALGMIYGTVQQSLNSISLCLKVIFWTESSGVNLLILIKFFSMYTAPYISTIYIYIIIFNIHYIHCIHKLPPSNHLRGLVSTTWGLHLPRERLQPRAGRRRFPPHSPGRSPAMRDHGSKRRRCETLTHFIGK